jgi:hypothetical protein
MFMADQRGRQARRAFGTDEWRVTLFGLADPPNVVLGMHFQVAINPMYQIILMRERAEFCQFEVTAKGGMVTKFVVPPSGESAPSA